MKQADRHNEDQVVLYIQYDFSLCGSCYWCASWLL